MTLTDKEKKDKGFISLKGNLYPTMGVLLNEAHQKYKDKFSIKTKLIEFDRDSKFAIFMAQVVVGDGEHKQIFTGYGDSAKDNTGGMIQSSYLRMAETRAVVRALRFATNIGDTGLEEMP